jgi:hypothetical protein
MLGTHPGKGGSRSDALRLSCNLVRLLDAERIDRVVAVDVLRRSDMRRFWVGLKERVS